MTHHTRPDGFWGFASNFEIIYPKCAHLMNITYQKWTFAPIYRKRTAVGRQIFWLGMELLNNTHHTRPMDFGDLPKIWKYSIENVHIC